MEDLRRTHKWWYTPAPIEFDEIISDRAFNYIYMGPRRTLEHYNREAFVRLHIDGQIAFKSKYRVCSRGRVCSDDWRTDGTKIIEVRA